jgi:hypothetical protein
MIELIPEKGFIRIKCGRILTHQDYQDVLIPALEKAFAEKSPLRALCDMRDLEKIDWKALWDDFKFGIHHLKDVERMATVGNQWWLSFLMRFANLFFKVTLKNFKSHQLEEATEWINRKK